jgi:enoyl-CoA hydratase
MDAVFHMHHFAHAQNDLVTGSSIGGMSGKAAAAANKKAAEAAAGTGQKSE